MESVKRLLCRLMLDESGGEVLEYSLVTGLIVVASIPVITQVGTKIVAKWNAINAAL